MFASKAGSYPSGAPFRDSILRAVVDLLANIGLGWKDLQETNTNLLGRVINYDSKKLDWPRCQFLRTFFSVNDGKPKVSWSVSYFKVFHASLIFVGKTKGFSE